MDKSKSRRLALPGVLFLVAIATTGCNSNGTGLRIASDGGGDVGGRRDTGAVDARLGSGGPDGAGGIAGAGATGGGTASSSGGTIGPDAATGGGAGQAGAGGTAGGTGGTGGRLDASV